MKTNHLGGLAAGLCLLAALESRGADPGWTRLATPVTSMLAGTHFVNENTGFVAGDSGVILRTTNGGATWTQSSAGGNEPLMYVHAFDSSLAYISAWNGKMVKTSNGGGQWSVVASERDSANARGIWFTSPATGFLCIGTYPSGGYSRILRTRNGGTSWDTVFTTAQWLSHIHFPDAGHGYATGSRGTIAKSADSGATWTSLILPDSMFMSGVFFLNRDTGYVGGVAGVVNNTYLHKKVFRTTDGGAHWTTVDTTMAAVSLFFVNDSTGYLIGGDSMLISGPFGAVGNLRLMKTRDGGRNWTRVDLGTGLNLNGFWFPSANVGYVTGDSGRIFKYQGGVLAGREQFPGRLASAGIGTITLASRGIQVGYFLPAEGAREASLAMYNFRGACVWRESLSGPDLTGGSHLANYKAILPGAAGAYVIRLSATSARSGARTSAEKLVSWVP